jgi:hypothetical protein
MAGKKARVNTAAKKIAHILISHMEATMTPAQARAMRRDLHKLAVSATK